MSKLTYATLFSGGGGADLGLSAAGLQHLWGIEYDDDIASVARANGLPVMTADVCAVDYAALDAPDLLHMSPPCQNMSIAKANATETEQDLAVADACCRAITALSPRYVTLENVWRYRKSDSWRTIRQTLEHEGYAWNAWLLNAADYGVAQTRQRMIVCAVLGGPRPTKPRPTHSKEPTPAGLFGQSNPRWVGWYEAIADLLPDLPDSQFAPWQMKRLPDDIRTMLVNTNQSGDEGARRDTRTREPAFVTKPSDDGRLRALLVDGTEQRGPAVVGGACPAPPTKATEYKGLDRALLVDDDNATKKGDIYHAQDMPANTVRTAAKPRALLVPNRNEYSPDRVGDEPSPTVGGGGGGNSPRAFVVPVQAEGDLIPFMTDRLNYSSSNPNRLAHQPSFTLTVYSKKHQPPNAWEGYRIVQMTPRALARFQSFPDTYVLPDTTKLACTVIGNAVPPLLMQRLAEHLTGHDYGTPIWHPARAGRNGDDR